MTGKQRVIVMMPAYNAAQFLATAVDSVLAQSYEDWELIIVDDGSTDKTAEIVARHAAELLHTRRGIHRSTPADTGRPTHLD